jgi:predicted nucleotidyltransferase
MNALAPSTAAKHAFRSRVHHWAQQLDVPVTALSLRPMRRKWASCSSHGRLSFSLDLLPLDPDLWDFVIVHELLHIQIPNHGRLWKSLMHAHLGDWQQAQQRLQQHGDSLPSRLSQRFATATFSRPVRLQHTESMSAVHCPSSDHYVVDEPLLRTIAAQIQSAIPGAEVRLFGSRARGTARPDSDVDLLITVPDAWLASHSRFEETGALAVLLSQHRIPIDLLLYSQQEVQQRRQYSQHVVTEAYRTGRKLHAF